MTPDVALLVMNPRNIGPCVRSFEQLENVDVCWLSRFTEWELQTELNQVIEETGYRFYLVVSDDGIVAQEAVDLVVAQLRDGHPVVTGYSNLDESDMRVNLTLEPVVGASPSSPASYGELWGRVDVEMWPQETVPTGFVGMALTGMSRDMWLRFPFRVMGNKTCSWGSDWSLSTRLRDAGIPMVAARGAFVWHVKRRVNEGDQTPGRELLTGLEPSEVRWQPAPVMA